MSSRETTDSNYGNFRKRATNPLSITFSDFSNPWNFFGLFLNDDHDVLEWCRTNGLLLSNLRCPKCNGECYLAKRPNKVDGVTWRCKQNINHEFSNRKYSFFENSKLDIRDVLEFIRNFIDGHTLFKSAILSGINYKRTAVDWVSFIRELFKEYVSNEMKDMKLSGIVEIDESLFGKKCKYHRGNRNSGVRVWIVGLVARGTNKLIMYPVSNRNAETLETIILRHVEIGSTIYTDSWGGYDHLNTLGYQHFSLVHKLQFKKSFKNVDTGDIVEVDTNTIEGAWKHAKDHFRKINGTSVSNFESHLCEILWRNHYRSDNKYSAFFTLLKSVFTLQKSPDYTYTTPVFDTWLTSSQNESNTTISRLDDDINASDSESDVSDKNAQISHSPLSTVEVPTASAASCVEVREQSGARPKTNCRKGKRKDKTKCPTNFEPVQECEAKVYGPKSSTPKKEYVTRSKRVVKAKKNKSFLQWSSSDDDFKLK